MALAKPVAHSFNGLLIAERRLQSEQFFHGRNAAENFSSGRVFKCHQTVSDGDFTQVVLTVGSQYSVSQLW